MKAGLKQSYVKKDEHLPLEVNKAGAEGIGKNPEKKCG